MGKTVLEIKGKTGELRNRAGKVIVPLLEQLNEAVEGSKKKFYVSMSDWPLDDQDNTLKIVVTSSADYAEMLLATEHWEAWMREQLAKSGRRVEK